MRGTLTLRRADPVHALIFPTILYNLYTIAISKYSDALASKNYVRVIALALNSRIGSFMA